MKQLIFRRTYYNSISLLPPEHRLEAYDALMAYAFTDELPEVSQEIKPVFSLIIDSVDADFRRFEEENRGRA